MAAGTAAALVPIRTITRRADPSSEQSLASSEATKQHPRVSFAANNEETVNYIPEGQEDAGPLCLRLLTQLKAIQLGQLQDEFGWRQEVSEADGKAVVGEGMGNGEGNGQTVDQLD